MSSVTTENMHKPLPSSPKQITAKFKEILVSNGITHEVLEVLMNNAELKGENFASDTCCVTVKFTNLSLKPLNLFVKTESSSERNREILRNGKFFEKEALFFTKYFPAVKKFLKIKGQENLLNIYPKCYHADATLVVLEHLMLDRGFELLDKKQMHDFDTARFALTTLAKHHAISYSYSKEIGGVKELIKRFPYIEFESFDHCRNPWEDIFEFSIQTSIQILSNSKAEGRDNAIDALKEKQGRVWDHLMNVQTPDLDCPYLVLNHGDYWNNNMLFKRDKETKKLVEHIAIDFQVVRIDSPGSDISSYLYSSVDLEVRQTRLKELLTIYLETLNETTAMLNHPLELTYEELHQDLRRRLDYGFWFFGVWIASRASYSVLEDLTDADTSEWAAVYKQSVQKWMDVNPEMCEEDAVNIVKLMREYKELTVM